MIHIRRKFERRSHIDITSLIDLVFLLVAFFMVTSRLGTDSAINVNLPRADSRGEQPVRSLVISVTEKNALYVNDKPVEMKNLETVLAGLKKSHADKRIIIRGDEKSSYNTIVKVMDALNKNGMSRFTLSTVR